MYKLLIVDDNISDRNGLAELVDWKELDIGEVYLAKNGEEGVKKAQEINPALIITDISMPIMNGLEMAQKILQKLPETKFIFISCYDDAEYVRSAMEYNAFGYLLKPINLDKLVEAVRKILQVKKSEREINNKVSMLQSKLREAMPYMQEIALQDLIYEHEENVNCEKLSELNMSLSDYYALVIVNPDCENEQNSYFLTYCIKQYMIEGAHENMRAIGFIQNLKSIVFMIYLDGYEDRRSALDALFEYLNEVKAFINGDMSQNVMMCIGGVSDNISEISEVYKGAEYILKNNIYRTGNMILLAEETECAAPVSDFDINGLKSELNRMFANETFDEAENFINERYEQKTYNKYAIKAFTYSLISILQLILVEQNESFLNVYGDDKLIWNKLSDYNTILDIKQWVINIYRFAFNYIKSKDVSDGKYTRIVKNIKKLIDENYGTIETVNQISDKIYISASYANTVFKESEGVTIFEYLVKVRMEKAKEMLENTTLKVYEISEKVGYASKTYFSNLFREYTGQTPKQYRQSKRQA